MATQNLESIKAELARLVQADKFAKYVFLTTPVGDDVIELPKEEIVPVLRFLRETSRFDFLMDLCGADYPEREATGGKRFEVIYHLFSSRNYQRIRLKARVGEHETIETATRVWKNANWFEREAFDMFGIKFEGHPNLRRILVHHEFVGHPLRKDYDADQQQHCSTTLGMQFEPDPNWSSEGKSLVPLNIGPAHPATHGTLRAMVELDGENGRARRSRTRIFYIAVSKKWPRPIRTTKSFPIRIVSITARRR